GSGPVIYFRISQHGIWAGFRPGGRRDLKVGPIQQAIRSNSRLFQRYLDSRRIYDRYFELSGFEDGNTTRWPLPKTARKWSVMDGFMIGESFQASDPILARRTFLDRAQEVFLDLYPLWIFAGSDRIKEDMDLYGENAQLLSRPISKAAD
ncbi:MAG TPA: hypothetical protein VJX67_00735, partial [Blastocatellia bacterium]|nr:hypothetical protein [Blastocatellia bacterium]